MVGGIDWVNSKVAESWVGRWFQLEGSGHPKERAGSRFLTELRAGVTTWAAMVYIISVNANIVSDSGGPCVCPTDDLCLLDVEYLACVGDVRRDLITSTAALSALSSFLIGLFANLPIGMAPGLSLNAYFAYSVVGFHGSGQISYQEALGAVFLEGWLFFILSVMGLRQWLVRLMPRSLVLAVGAGIGLFIAFIGLSSAGLDVIGGDTSHYVGLGGCKPDAWMEGMPHFCQDSGVLRSPTMWLGVFIGGLFTSLLMLYRVRGAILIGIFLTSIISWPRATPFTFFPYNTVGDDAFDFFKQVATFRPLQRIGNVLEFNYTNGRVWYALITFLYVDILDTTGTMYSMAKFAGLCDPVTMDFEHSTLAYCIDAICISIGSLLGCSPTTAYIESATGISEGGKTGITGITVGLMMFISIFFAPIFASIPPWATGGALVIVGSLMISNVRAINWAYPADAIPAFLAVIIIPLSYNVAYGIIAGVLSYILLNSIAWGIAKASGDRIVPPGRSTSEDWFLPQGTFLPPWMHMVKDRYRDRKSSSDLKNGPIPLDSRDSHHDGPDSIAATEVSSVEHEPGTQNRTNNLPLPKHRVGDKHR